MEPTVRRIAADELDKLLALYQHLNPEDVVAPRERLTAEWEFIMKNSDRFAYFVIEAAGELVASCNVTIIPNLTRGARSIAVIENVITHPDCRRQGFGRMVMAAAVGYAKEKDCYKVMLLSSTKRVEAHQFYERLGFDKNSKKGFEKRFL